MLSTCDVQILKIPLTPHLTSSSSPNLISGHDCYHEIAKSPTIIRVYEQIERGSSPGMTCHTLPDSTICPSKWQGICDQIRRVMSSRTRNPPLTYLAMFEEYDLRSRRDQSSPTSSLTGPESGIASQDRRWSRSSSRHAHDCSGSCIAGHGHACASRLADAVGGGAGEGGSDQGGQRDELGEMHGGGADVV